MCFIYIRKQLNEINRLQSLLTSVIWIMYGHLLMEKETSIMSTDIIHNYLTNVVCRISRIMFSKVNKYLLFFCLFLVTTYCLYSRSK